jgi:hypothetical protein
MRNIDWQMLLFAGGAMVQEIWIYYGLPRVYYMSATRNVDDKTDAA